jgi:hypothetical protein
MVPGVRLTLRNKKGYSDHRRESHFGHHIFKGYDK